MHVLTYNIAGHLSARNPSHLREVAELLIRTLADVVGLQEVVHREDEEPPEEVLARLTGLHVAFVPAHQGKKKVIGNAVLSRQPITETLIHPLPGSFPEKRVALEARTTIQDQPVSVFNTHLVHLASLGYLWRRRQAESLSEILRACPRPHVLMGDLNACSSARELHSVRRHFGALEEQFHRLRTWPAHRPLKHYDQIWPGPGWAVEKMHVLERHVSDHLPVLARLRWDHHRRD